MPSAALSRFIALVLMAAGLGTAYWVYDEAVRPIWENEPSADWAVLEDGSLATGAPAQNEVLTTEAVLQTPTLTEAELSLEVTASSALEEIALSLNTTPETGGMSAEETQTSGVFETPTTDETTEAGPARDPGPVPSVWSTNLQGAEADVPVRAPVQIGPTLD